MSPTRVAAFAATLAIVLSACATRVSVPEIPVLDSPVFKEAKRDEKPPVKIVEVPKPLSGTRADDGELRETDRAGQCRDDSANRAQFFYGPPLPGALANASRQSIR